MMENPEIEYISDLIDSESYDLSEKTQMQIEHDYKIYKHQTRWEDHILKIASEKEVI